MPERDEATERRRSPLEHWGNGMSAQHLRLFIVSMKYGLSQDFFYSWCWWWIWESLYVHCKWITAGSFVDVYWFVKCIWKNLKFSVLYDIADWSLYILSVHRWVKREDRNSVEVWKWEFRRSCSELLYTQFDATSLKVDRRTRCIPEGHNGETLWEREGADPGQLGEPGKEQGATWNCYVYEVTYSACHMMA